MSRLSFEDIQSAHQRITPYVHRTPIITSETLNRLAGGALYFKCENFQKTGAFKIRGATNAVFSLPFTGGNVIAATHSSGNHAAALAKAAAWKGIQAIVVMPENSPKVKKEAVLGYGALIRECAPTLAAREAGLREVVRETRAEVIHPYDDERIIAGQGTAAMELIQDVDDLDMVLAPVGGGGLLSGTALACSFMSPETRVIGVEPEQADDAWQSFYSGRLMPSENPETLADGLRTSLSDRTFSIIREHVNDIVTVPEEAIIQAMRMVWERMKLVIEPSAAVPVAAILLNKVDLENRRAGIILTGGNVDLGKLPWVK